MQIMLCNFLFARCVYFDMAIKKWVGPDDVCQVTNNLDLGTDDFVDCSCKHMTSYAIVAKTTEAGLVGYTLWFYIACFICIVRVEEFSVVMVKYITVIGFGNTNCGGGGREA